MRDRRMARRDMAWVAVLAAIVASTLPLVADDGSGSPAGSMSAEAAPTPVADARDDSDDGLNRAEPIDLTTVAEKAARYPNNPHLLNEYANQLLHKGRLAEAVAYYEKSVKLSPEFVQAWNNLGVAHQAQRAFGKARRAYRKALDLAPNYALVHYNLGTAYDATGKYDKAIASYQKAIQLDPNLLKLEINPQIATNKHLSAILLQTYVDQGGSAFFPVVSAYPDSR